MAIDADLRTIVITEDQQQFTNLGIKQLCFGQKVIGPDGSATVNLIWRSDQKAPTTSILWRVKYGLNWTKAVPTVGIVVNEGGVWLDCHLGSNYKVNKDGYFEIVPGGTPNEITIVDNAHGPIYPILGVWDEDSKHYRPAYVDPTTLDTGGNSQYQPQSENETWFAANVKTSEMISYSGTSVARFNTGVLNPTTKFYVWNATYEPLTGVRVSTALVSKVVASRFNLNVVATKKVRLTRLLGCAEAVRTQYESTGSGSVDTLIELAVMRGYESLHPVSV